MVYVMDATALHAIPDYCGNNTRCVKFLTDLELMLDAEEIAFCRRTVDALRDLAESSTSYLWARQTVGQMWCARTNWQHLQHVTAALEGHNELELQTEDPESHHVLALAQSLCEECEVTIVTEDDREKPDLICLVDAAAVLGWTAQSLADFAVATGLDRHSGP
jgi:hypothetical protein